MVTDEIRLMSLKTERHKKPLLQNEREVSSTSSTSSTSSNTANTAGSASSITANTAATASSINNLIISNATDRNFMTISTKPTAIIPLGSSIIKAK